MAVVGIDLGTLHSKIGVARRKGIDIITNEVSNRATPSLVAFGPKQRALGEAAKTGEISNFRNTIGSLKRLIGRTLQDKEVQEVETKFTHAKLVDVNGTVGVEVTYQGEKATFSSTQVLAMYLGKLRDIATAEIKNTVSDVVLAIPGWFTDIQRRAVLDAAAIANLNPLRLMNDTTAVAFGYGITKSDLPEDPDNARHVVFIDMGHSSLSVAVAAFSKGQLTIKATAYDPHLGGRDIDYALVQYFAEEFKGKYKIDVLSNPKATFRLYASAERLKKILSANTEAPLSVESIMNDIDASSKLGREDYEQLISGVLDRIPLPLQQALQDSGLSLEQIDAVELVGGSTRIPAVRAKIQSVFVGKALSTTLNQDEACARGATFTCATLSPVFRVKEFANHDTTHYPIKVQWEPTPGDGEEETELVVFPKRNNVPSTKVLTFYRKEAFDLQALYAEPELLPGSINPWIARVTIKGVQPNEAGDFSTVKVKTRLNANGILSFEDAYTETVEERDEPVPEGAEGEAAEPKKKKYSKKHTLPIVAGYGGTLESSVLNEFKEKELQMHENDKLVQDTEDRKNALEEYIYDVRGKLDERYAAFVQPEEKEKLLAELAQEEDWLYSEDGEDALKSAYVSRLDALKALGDPIVTRWREFEERPRAAARLRESVNYYQNEASSPDDKYAHIDEKDRQSVVEKAVTIQKWLEDQSIRQMERPKNVDAVLTSAQIEQKRDELIFFATPILSRPKPKPPKVDANADTPKSGQQTPNPPPQAEQQQEEASANEPTEMDVD
ncbi:heat shock protein 70 [Vararia minispora EC-137]|uniref:Heat shock protein 70 n=1 Tax=Vararia minispora EC-137 TaxID=1314806 RepID=A0ACB8QLW2_9AGAM|nr:heat shock protein 70 [Vararia minispora EC-137]